MNFLKNLFSDKPMPANFMVMNVRCKKCGEVIEVRINLGNELSLEYDDRGREIGYICRKGIIGSGHCYQMINMDLRFGMNHKLLDKQITNGDFVE